MVKKFLAVCLVLCAAFAMAGTAAASETKAAAGERNVSAAEAAGNDSVYVSADGSDMTGTGTAESPYATLKTAVDKAETGGTVYVMSSLTVNECARYYDKDLTITSYGGLFTLTRGEKFKVQDDPARKSYNPAMIEVGGTKGEKSASLLLTDIVIDDGGKHTGAYFVQADSEGDGHTTVGKQEVANTDIVQDGIIATYNGVGTVTLGEGAVLKNYGGMSAVRLAGGELIMEEGSRIIDDKEILREKGESGSFGPAGAVWIQGGTLTMKGGTIGGDSDVMMHGRAVYVDSGTACIGGTVRNIKGTDAAWQGQNGVAVHLRSHGEARLTETGKITNVTGDNNGNNCAVWSQFCNFTADAGSLISEVDGFQMLHFDDLDNNNYSHEVYLDGTISDCDSGSACLLRSWYGQITFGENSIIENCSSTSAGGLIYSNNGSHYTFSGTIRNNRASSGMIYLANQSGGGVVATIEPTAHIVDNSGLGIRVNNSSNLTMKGGEISRNTGAGVKVSAKDRWKGVTFIMSGGTIADNGGTGVDATIGGDAVVRLEGGSVYGNGGDAEVTVWNDYTDSPSAYADNVNDHLHIGKGVLQGSRTVNVKHGYDSLLGAISLNRTLGTVTLDDNHEPSAWAFANPEAVEKITELVKSEKTRENWKAAGKDAYWFKPDAESYHFKVTRPKDAVKTDLYLAYIPMNDNGTVPEDAGLTLMKVGSGNQIDVTMDGLDPGKAYAFMFVNSGEYTLTADGVTGYIGGGSGDEITASGFPSLTVSDSVDTIKELKIKDVEYSNGDLMGKLLENLEAVYTYEDGSIAGDDSRSGEYIVELKWKNGLKDEDVRINGNSVKLGEGKLIVRHTGDIAGAQSGTTTHELLTSEPSAPVEHAEAIAKKGDIFGTYEPDFYINDDENKKAAASGIQILDDVLLADEDGTDRQKLLEEKAEKYLGVPKEGLEYRYDFHYLDLVDAFNGNSWVSAKYGTSVYLPYPEGITSENAEELNLKVIHYRGLHREYGISGQAEIEEAIDASELETLDVEFDVNGIKFDVSRGGFSPFAVVWQVEATGGSGTGDPDEPGVPEEPADPDEPDVPDQPVSPENPDPSDPDVPENPGDPQKPPADDNGQSGESSSGDENIEDEGFDEEGSVKTGDDSRVVIWILLLAAAAAAVFALELYRRKGSER